MKAILILGGKSRRFWPLTEKPLFPICGKTLAEHQVERLNAAGIEDIVIVANVENVKRLSAIFPKLSVIVQPDEMGMQHAIEAALPECGSSSVLIVSGNDIVETNAYADLKKEAAKKNVAGALLAARVKTYFPGGYLTVEDGRAMGIVEKPGAGNEPSDLVTIVAHVHTDASILLKALQAEKGKTDDGYERALDHLMKESNYRAVPYDGTWQAVKYPWHLLPLLELLLKDIRTPSIHKTASVHPTAVIDGNVILAEGVRVLPHATVRGPAYIGKNSVIGNNALVRDSSIGEGCVVGYSTEVKGSVLAGPVWTHMAYLGDSVIGHNVSFGGGCITGNLRLDEGDIGSVPDPFSGAASSPVSTGLTKMGLTTGDDCRFGIQVGTNPGVKIGSGSFIGGGVFITEDIPEGSFVVMKEGKVEVRKNKTKAPGMEERKKYFR